MKLDPLDINQKGTRFLNDRGIARAIEHGFITIQPALDFTQDTTRLQPATLDLQIKRITESETLSRLYPSKQGFWAEHALTVAAKTKNEVLLTESILHDSKVPEFNVPFIFPRIEGRSSVRRLGCFAPSPGYFFTDPNGSHIELANYAGSDIIFDEGERVAQSFFVVDPFRDQWLGGFDVNILDMIRVQCPKITSQNLEETFATARELDMGIEVTTDEQIKWLVKEGYMSITPEIKVQDGYVLVHASNEASTINKIPEGILFKDRKIYADKLTKPLNISKGYAIKPYEHVDIETKEQFKLSPHVGIHFYNNPKKKFLDQVHENPTLESMENLCLTEMIDGWVDPGYEGGFSRQPKWFSTTHVKPGDIIGFGRVIYFPNGVGNAYGDTKLGSQYQGAEKTRFAK